MQRKNYFGPDEDIIDICDDNVFKAVFTRGTPESQGALSKLVSALIGYDVTIIDILANEPPVDDERDRQIRYDINCKTEDGELVEVEMSLNPYEFEPLRLEYYSDKLFTRQDIKGREKNYDDIKRTYQIAILANKHFFPNDEFFHSFEYYDPIRGISLGGKGKIITLELSKLDKIAGLPTGDMSIKDKWAFYFRYCADREKRDKINEIVFQEEGIAMASQVLSEITQDDHEWAYQRRREKYELDRQSELVTAIRKERKDIARKMKNANKPYDEIYEFTGLSQDEVKKL